MIIGLYLQPISASARKHLVDAEHVERVHAHTQMERVLASILHHILVGCNACCLQRLTGDVLLLPTVAQQHTATSASLAPGSLRTSRLVYQTVCVSPCHKHRHQKLPALQESIETTRTKEANMATIAVSWYLYYIRQNCRLEARCDLFGDREQQANISSGNFVPDQMDAEGILIYWRPLCSHIIDANLRVRDTTAVP
jgi:hypothetical protein